MAAKRALGAARMRDKTSFATGGIAMAAATHRRGDHRHEPDHPIRTAHRQDHPSECTTWCGCDQRRPACRVAPADRVCQSDLVTAPAGRTDGNCRGCDEQTPCCNSDVFTPLRLRRCPLLPRPGRCSGKESLLRGARRPARGGQDRAGSDHHPRHGTSGGGAGLRRRSAAGDAALCRRCARTGTNSQDKCWCATRLSDVKQSKGQP